MTTQTFALPDLGEGLTEAEIVRWMVGVGDVVAVDQAIVEVETAKSVVEVPSPYAGRVAVLHADEGSTLDVGKPLISVAAQGMRDAAAERYREEEQAGSGNVLIGYGTSGTAGGGRRRRRKVAPVEKVAPAEPVRVPRVTSPLVRKMARDAGLALGEIVGSGPRGLIVRQDVVAAIAARRTDPPASPAPSVPGGSPRTGLSVRSRVPMSGFRKAVAASLSRSRAEVPEATVWVDVDFTDLVAMREAGTAAGRPTPSLLAYLARFTLAALKAYPELNGEVDAERHELVQYDGVNLGIAAQTDRGLVVPAIANAHTLTTLELDGELRRITAAAREGKATPAELASGTFTLNNYGAFNVDGSAAIVNHPQVAILGFGRVIDRAWVVDGELAVRKIGQMSFVFDHRVCDGGTAAGFMRVVADAIESPASAIAHL